MRTDDSLDESVADSGDWETDRLTGKSEGDVNRYKLPHARKAKLSLSGSERNHLFVKDHDGVFVDVSGNSGLDSANDGRSIAVFDFDRDGLQDFLLTNSNGKTLNLFRNQIGDLSESNQFIAIRFAGGNKSGKPVEGFSNRDGIGVRVRVSTEEDKILRELLCGEGLAAQNSRTLIVGLGPAVDASAINVEWPSGLSQQVENIASQSLITFFEDKLETEDGSGVLVEKYRRVENAPAVASIAGRPFPVVHQPVTNGIAVYTAMATWCTSCRKHLPDLARIKESFDGNLPVYAIPIDAQDDSVRLSRYMQQFRPAYELLQPDADRTKSFMGIAQESIGDASIPFSVLVAADGTVIKVIHGLPTISELRQALAARP